jgi:hypothetical protein
LLQFWSDVAIRFFQEEARTGKVITLQMNLEIVINDGVATQFINRNNLLFFHEAKKNNDL